MSLNSSCAMASSILIPLICREPAIAMIFETFFANVNIHGHPCPSCLKSSLVLWLNPALCPSSANNITADWRSVLSVRTSISPFLPGTTSCLCYTWSAFCCGGPPAAEKEAQVKGYVETCRPPILEGLYVVVNHISNVGDVESVQLSPKQRLTAGLLGSSDSWGGYTFKFLFSQFFASREALVWRHDSCWWPTGLCNL